MRQAWHIKEAFELLLKKEADSVVAVTEIPGHHSPYWAVVVDENSLGKLFIGDHIRNRIPRRQNLPQKLILTAVPCTCLRQSFSLKK